MSPLTKLDRDEIYAHTRQTNENFYSSPLRLAHLA